MLVGAWVDVFSKIVFLNTLLQVWPKQTALAWLTKARIVENVIFAFPLTLTACMLHISDSQKTPNSWPSSLQEHQDGVPQAHLPRPHPAARQVLQGLPRTRR